jgi:hypothetical protein
MELLQFTIAAGETKRFERAGRYLEIIDASGRLNVDLSAAHGGRAASMLNALSGFFVEELHAAFEVSNPEAYSQAVMLMISADKGGSRRQPGIVRVVDEGVDKTNAGTQFYGTTRRIANAAKFSLAGIMAGTKSMTIRRVSFAAGAAGQLLVWSGTGAPTDTYVSQVIRNKKIGGADAIGTRFTALAAAQIPTVGEVPGLTQIMAMYVPANELTQFELSTPLVLPAGSCFGVSGPAINTEVAIGFDLEEI